MELLGKRLCAHCKPARVGELYRTKIIYPDRVVFWARVFDWVLAAPALFWAAVCIYAFLWPDPERNEYIEIYVAAAVVGLLFPLVPALALGPKRRWAYYYQMLTITVGTLLGGCTLGPLSVLLWIPAGILFKYLIRLEVQEYCLDGI